MAVLIRSESRPELFTRTCRKTMLVRRLHGLCLNGSSLGVSFGAAVSAFTGGMASGHVRHLRVPLNEMKDYDATLDRRIARRRLLDLLPSWPT